MSSPAATVLPQSTASETANLLEIIDITAVHAVALQPGLRKQSVNQILFLSQLPAFQEAFLYRNYH